MRTSSLYRRLAVTNIKNNRKTCVPYILTCIGTILMFYNMIALTYNTVTGNGSISALMQIGTIVTGLFSTIFIFYTNSFLVKRRKKEFGLYNVLGMEKKHVGRVIFWENTIIGALSIVLGLILGILFSKIVTLLLYKLLHFDPYYGFEVSPRALITTVILFVFIFILTLLSSLHQVHKASPIELLRGGDVGEREPKSNWVLAILGVLTLGAGYYIAVTVDNPLAALTLFFVAVILVIIGTYCLFTAGSVVLLKTLKKKKSYYYKTNHFISLSGMIYRMKKNAVGLANICIMSTAVLVMISTTVSMYIGMEDLMRYRYPQDAKITVQYDPDTRYADMDVEGVISGILDGDGVAFSGMKGYESFTMSSVRDGATFSPGGSNDYLGASNVSVINFIPAGDFSRLAGENIALADDEVILVSERDESSIVIFGRAFTVTENRRTSPVEAFSTYLADTVTVVVSSHDVIDDMFSAGMEAYDGVAPITYTVSFDFVNEDDDAVADYCVNDFTRELSLLNGQSSGSGYGYAIRQMNIAEFYLLYGGLFFLGIFLGFLFMLATVLIIYYKQVIEGFEDKERFKIMQNVGMSRAEVRRTINSQVLSVFALPILAAVVHIAFAFPILTKLLVMLNLTNVKLFVVCTIATVVVFAIVYALIYFATSKVYYKIVNGTSD